MPNKLGIESKRIALIGGFYHDKLFTEFMLSGNISALKYSAIMARNTCTLVLNGGIVSAVQHAIEKQI